MTIFMLKMVIFSKKMIFLTPKMSFSGSVYFAIRRHPDITLSLRGEGGGSPMITLDNEGGGRRVEVG